jgi:hypothetical protein
MNAQRKPFGPAYLPSAGLKERRATLHTFSHSDLVTVKVDGRSVTGLGHFYRCTETDEVRQWGFDVTYAKDNGGN